MKDLKLTNMIKQLLKESEVKVKSSTKSTYLHSILTTLSELYGQRIEDNKIKDEWKNYTIGQIIDDWNKLVERNREMHIKKYKLQKLYNKKPR